MDEFERKTSEFINGDGKPQRNTLPTEPDRDMRLNKLFPYQYMTPYQDYIEEYALNTWDTQDAILKNIEIIENYELSTIQVGVHGPTIPQLDEYVLFPFLPSKPSLSSLSNNFPMLVDSHLVGGKIPVKIQFMKKEPLPDENEKDNGTTNDTTTSRRGTSGNKSNGHGSNGKKKKKKPKEPQPTVGYIFSLDRTDMGYLVCYMDNEYAHLERIQPNDFQVCRIEKEDYEAIQQLENEYYTLITLTEQC